MTDETRDQLDDLGGTEVPPPDPVFAERLEERLRSGAAVSANPAVPPPRRGRWPGLILRPGVAVTAIALVGIIGAVWFGRDDLTSDVLALTAARESFVVLPDGTEIDAVPGLEVPDGAVIEVGSDGSVTIDGTQYDSGSVLEINNGRVRTVTDRPLDQPTGGPAVTTTVVSDQPPPTDHPVDVAPSETNPPPPTSTTITPPTSATDRPDPTRPVVPPPTTRLVAPTVTLEVVPLPENRWRLVWTVRGDGEISGWVVRGAAGNPAPDPQAGDGRRVSVLRTPEIRELVVSPPGDAAQVAYVIEARGAEGVLATSNTVVVTLEREG